MPRRRPERADPTSGRRSEAAERLRGLAKELQKPLEEANRQLALIADGSADRDMATAAASLLRAITSAVAERRQLERHELRLAEEMAEAFLQSATSGEESEAERRDRILPEESGGPFVRTRASQEFAYDFDESNIAEATREPLPKTSLADP